MRTVPAIAIVTLLLLPACGGDLEPQTVNEPTQPAPAAAASEAPTQPPATPTGEPAPTPTGTATAASASQRSGPTVEIFYVRDSGRGPFVEPEPHRLNEPTVGVALAAMQQLVGGQPRDPGLTNAMPEGTRLLGVRLDDETLTVDLDFPNDNVGLGAAYEGALYEQIRHTGAQFDTVRRVEILEEGGDPTSGHFLPEDLRGPKRPDEFALSPIIIRRPAGVQSVNRGEVTIRGTANVFEATVGLRLVNPRQEVVEETFTTATCGTGCRGAWHHTFTVDAPGRWTVVAFEDDPSDGEGGGPFTTERTFTVR